MLLIILLIFFCVLTLVFAGRKGARALISFAGSGVLFTYVLVPTIAHHGHALLVSSLVGLAAACIIIYGTEGWHNVSHLAILCVAFIASIVLPCFWGLIQIAHIDGYAAPGIEYLVGTSGTFNPQDILFAAIILGTLAVLCETSITQVSTVAEFWRGHHGISQTELYKKTFSVGAAHLGSSINTLFLLYASTSLPVMIAISGTRGMTITQLNNPVIVTEAIRILAGALSVVLVIPLSTLLAATYYSRKIHSDHS